MESIVVAFNKSIAREFEAKLKAGQRGKYPYTPQQETFIREFLTLDNSLLAEAVAGSGKTSTLLDAALAVPKASWKCKTMHGLGYAAWQGKIGRRLIVNGDKLFNLLKDFELSRDERSIFGDILQLARIGKNSGIVPKIAPRGKTLLIDDFEIWEDLADHYDIQFSEAILHYVQKLLVASIETAWTGSIDYDDMLYMPVCFSGVFHKYDLVIVDEAQDLSAIQHVMLGKSLRRDGLLIAAGDRHQAIYGFRGALSESIPELVETFSLNPHPLTVSFRCPKAVVREAQAVVPHIEAFDQAPEGEVVRHAELSLADVPSTVLCRNTAPVVDLALRLIGSGRGAKIAGREIGKSLVRMVKSICPDDTPLHIFEQKLAAFIEAAVAKKPKREQALRDRENALRAISRRAGVMSGGSATTKNITAIIEELYAKDAPGAVYLSTIHKAKGLEWPQVLFLDDHLIPSSYASQPWQLEQEDNLRYVAVTRAQQVLHYAKSEAIF